MSRFGLSRRPGRWLAGMLAVAVAASGLWFARTRAVASIPRPDHVVIVIEENHGYSQVIGDSTAPYINGLAQQGANFTASHGVTHPSQPNYLALFSGSVQGVTDDSCPHTFDAPNLAAQLHATKLSFGGYSEEQPATGYAGCSSGGYVRKHNPWVDFTNVPAADNMPLGSFPTDFTTLPTVSIVVPNLCNDMHDCSVASGDAWLRQHLDAYIQWAKTHNSLFILTFDEDNFTAANQIPTIFAGPMVKPGAYDQNINHYNLLRTLEDMFGLPYAGASASAGPITNVWVGGGERRTPTPAGGIISFKDGVAPTSVYAGTRDTILNQNNPATAYASAVTGEVDGDDPSPTGNDKSALLRWNIAALPAAKTVTGARIVVHIVNPSANAYQIYEIKRNWLAAEGSVTWEGYGPGLPWQIAGAQGAGDRGATALGELTTAGNGFYTITLNGAGVALVQRWVNTPQTNYGLIIANSDSTDGVAWDSREAATPANRPELIITYQ